MQFYGKKIKSITIDEGITREDDGSTDGGVLIEMENGTACAFVSDQPDCCARHYMVTDDDLASIVGAKLLDVIVKENVDVKDEDGEVLETMFFDIITSKGTLNFRSHNSHNGYYGGVGVNFKVIRSLQQPGVFRT
jgi:hypothetical protein